MEILNLKENYNEEILTELYNTLYIKYFPEPIERLSLEFFKNNLIGLCKVGYVVNIFVCGENFEDKEKRIIKGFIIADYYDKTEIGLLTYLAVDVKYRKSNIVLFLIESVKSWLQSISNGKVKCVLAEIHNPAKVDFKDTIDPVNRIKIFKKYGLQYIPIRYIMPPLFKGSIKNHKTFLVAFHPTETFTPIILSRKLLKQFLFNFYKICDIEDPYSDLDFVNMINSIDEIGLKEIDLVPSIIFKE